MPADTRDRIVLEAMRLFAAKGYGSTSVADILHSAAVNSGSLYYFFPGKQDVLSGVLDAYREGIGPMLLAPAWRNVNDPIERVFALLAAYRRSLVSTDCLYGCPIGSVALELHEPDPPIRQRLADNFDGWLEAVEECYEAAGAKLPRDVDRHGLAVLTLTTMEGGVMLARTYRHIEPFDTAVDMLRSYVDSLLARAAGRGRPTRKSRRKRPTARRAPKTPKPKD